MMAGSMARSLSTVLKEARACRVCEHELPLGPRPVLSVAKDSRILVVGQAPGTKVHESGVPWQDDSGTHLCQWLGVSTDTFHDAKLFGILPMGFCYPGKGKSGDLPPRPECAPLWHDDITRKLPHVRLTLLIGTYAQKHYLGKRRKKTLTETVRAFEEYLPAEIPLPHPSWRSRIWMKKNPWFEAELLPLLRERVQHLT